MTTWFTRPVAWALTIAALSLAACKKDESRVTLSQSAAPALTASTTTPSLVLTTSNANETGATFTYTAANFGYSAATTYTLQVDKKGGDFSNAQSFNAGTSAGTITLSKGQLVTALLNLDYQPAVAAQADVRVLASVGSAAPAQVSPVVTLSVTPTPICIPNTSGRTWSLIGLAGTDWNTDRALTYDCYTQTFKTTIALKADEFKFRANNDWGVNLGISGATSSLSTSDLAKGVALVSGNNNLRITTAGTYKITLTPSADGASGTVTIKP